MLGGGVVLAVVADGAHDDSDPTDDAALCLGLSYGRYEYWSSSTVRSVRADGLGGGLVVFDEAAEGGGLVVFDEAVEGGGLVAFDEAAEGAGLGGTELVEGGGRGGAEDADGGGLGGVEAADGGAGGRPFGHMLVFSPTDEKA